MNAGEVGADAKAIADALADGAVETAQAGERIAGAMEGLPSAVDALRDELDESAGYLGTSIRSGLTASFVSPEEKDREGQRGANATDGLFAIARALERVGKALEGRKP